ncbi:MAG: DUF6398 domain-containing protein [Acetobacteraceae bacterium]
MIDDPQEVEGLLERLESSLPLPAIVTPELAAAIRERSSGTDPPRRCAITQTFYGGDEGGILCELDLGEGEHAKEAFIVSLTHLAFDPGSPLAGEIAAYQTHRIEQLQRMDEAMPSGRGRSRAATRGRRPAKLPGSMPNPVPKAMAAHYQALAGLTDAFCRRHLSEDYAQLARRAAAALCRKRPSPVLSGQPESWACGILYALGQINFLSDRSSTPHMTMQELCAGFGVSASTGGSKAKAVRDALGIRRWDHRWLLPENIAAMPMAWMIEVDGLPVDARDLPRPLQVAAYERGLIPYIPADGPEGEGGIRDAILARYDRYRTANTRLQTMLAKKLWKDRVVPVARRLGLAATEEEAMRRDPDDLAPAADLALYAAGADGTSAVQRYARENAGRLSERDRHMLEAMSAAVFSVFRVAGSHRGAGVDLTDLISGERFWVADRGLEASAMVGTELALRLFRPDDFWMTSGVAVVIDRQIREALEKEGLIQRQAVPGSPVDRNALAETVYRLALT